MTAGSGSIADCVQVTLDGSGGIMVVVNLQAGLTARAALVERPEHAARLPDLIFARLSLDWNADIEPVIRRKVYEATHPEH